MNRWVGCALYSFILDIWNFFNFAKLLKPGTHHAIFVFCWTQRRRKDDCRMVCAHQRRSSSVDFTNATVVGPILKTNRSNNCCMVCAGQRHPSHQPTDHRPITVKHLRDASTSDLRFGHNIIGPNNIMIIIILYQ